MKLKSKHEDRVIFLKLFTEEIIKNIYIRNKRKGDIEKGRVKQRISHIVNVHQKKEAEDNISKFIKKNYPESYLESN